MSVQRDLDELVAADVITNDTAQRIRQYYKNKREQPSNRFTIVLSILGSLLVGLGIVLVVAHNWDSLGVTAKTFFAFLPLAFGQALCIFTLLKRKEDIAWRESSAVILFFGIAACISLVSQIYHISGSMSSFLLTWALLTAPLIYVMRSHVTALLFIVLISWYACELGYWENEQHVPYLYIPLLLVVVPAYWETTDNTHRAYFGMYNWLVALSVITVFATFSGRLSLDLYEWLFIGYLALFCFYYVIGTSRFFRKHFMVSNPFMVLGIPGILFILFSWSFRELWIDSGLFGADHISWQVPFPYMVLALMIGILFLLVRRYQTRGWNTWSPTGFSVFFLVLAILVFNNVPATGVLFVNLWIFGLGLYYTRKGSIKNHLGILNLGLLIIALLAAIRFFDDSILFVWRGIFFLLAGIGFFAGNYFVIRKKKAMALKQMK